MHKSVAVVPTRSGFIYVIVLRESLATLTGDTSRVGLL